LSYVYLIYLILYYYRLLANILIRVDGVMEKQHKFSIWYVLIAIWIVIILHNLLNQMFAIERIPYSEFVNALQKEKVIEVAVTQDRIQGKMKTLKDGQEAEKAFSTVRVDPEVSELLEKYNVTFKGVAESNFLKNLASWIFPIILFVGIWYLMMRRFIWKTRSE